MYESVVYEGDKVVGVVEIYAVGQIQNGGGGGGFREIRISHCSAASERCPPLAVLHTVTSSGVCFKMESKSQPRDSQLHLLHSSCLRENKTAVMLLGGEELHLVAMPSRKNGEQGACFWGFIITNGLYNSCLALLNLRCLGIVFDLDETLIVANTMRSFEDRIDALQRKINMETDPQRVSSMLAEVKRYQDDKIILKQYAENDQVVENGKVMNSQHEVVPALSDNHQPIVRPVIRLQENNIILTRINPLIRDTSVLVRLRPAWEDLRSYLTARGRKRFEVYVCTMAERDYALEMWRLLDPDSNLINSKALLDRIVCVKPGSRKSLFNVFQEGICHPKMALVIDDRLKVWDEKDQRRVHVVPAFAPYYAPEAEANNSVPVLRVARNVACDVRGGFFKDFDEGLLQKISEVSYEDDIGHIPYPPDVSNYLISEEEAVAMAGNKDSLFDGMTGVELERRLKDTTSAYSAASLTVGNLDPRLALPTQCTVASSSISIVPSTLQGSILPFSNKQLTQVTSVVKPFGQVGFPEGSLQSSPSREEGEVPESELDPDTRRRLLILQHGQDTRDYASSEPQFPARPPVELPVPQVQARGSWFPGEEKMSSGQVNRVPQKEFTLNSEAMNIDKHRHHHIPSDQIFPETQRFPKEVVQRDDRLRLNQSMLRCRSFPDEVPSSQSSSSNRDLDAELGQVDPYAESPTGALQDIAINCGTQVEFRSALVSSTALQFSVEVWFSGKKIGEGIGRTRREAQHQAAEGSLMNLADKYLSHLNPASSSLHGDDSRFSNANGITYVGDANSFGYQPMMTEESVPRSNALELPRVLDPRLDSSKKPMGSVSALKEYVEMDGQVMGKGLSLTWEEAQIQAAENTLGTLKSMHCQYPQKRQGSPRSLQGIPSKRVKPEFFRVPHRMPSYARYPNNASPFP